MAMPVRRAEAFNDLLQARKDREDIGLPPLPCGTILTSGRRIGEPCDKAPMPNHIRCGWHRYDVPSTRSAQQIAAEAREEMAVHLLPKSMAVVDDVLTREAEVMEGDDGIPVVVREAPKDSDRLKAAAMVMDRVGLAPGTDIRLTQEVRVRPPMELLAEAMKGIAERMGLVEPTEPGGAHVVIPGEVVEADLRPEQPSTGPGAQPGGGDV